MLAVGLGAGWIFGVLWGVLGLKGAWWRLGGAG